MERTNVPSPRRRGLREASRPRLGAGIGDPDGNPDGSLLDPGEGGAKDSKAVAGGRRSNGSYRAPAFGMALGLGGFGVSRKGVAREGNEDSMLVGGGADGALFVVADGMGGHAAGEVASRIAVEAFGALPAAVGLDEAVREANGRIFEAQDGGLDGGGLSGMGATVVALRFSRAEAGPEAGLVAEVAHVGDSRAYLFRDGLLLPLTEDHSFVNALVKDGIIDRKEASRHPQRNIITRALGTGDARPDLAYFEALTGDRVLLCSDGLHEAVSEHAIAGSLGLSARGGPREAVRALVRAAFEARGRDDVTAVVVDVAAPGRAGRIREAG